MEKNRIEWIDTAKGVGLLLVIFGHCSLADAFNFWLYAFHMSLFFLLSGYTFSPKGGYAVFLGKKVRSLLVPYVFFAVVTMVYEFALTILQGSSFDFPGIVKAYVISDGYTLLWFLTCLFLAEQIMYALDGIIKRFGFGDYYWLGIALLFLVLFYCYREFVNISLPWNADLSIMAVPLMCLGAWAGKTDALKKFFGNIYIVLMTVVWLGASYFNFSLHGRVDWRTGDFGNLFLFVLGAVGGSVVCIYLCMIFHNKFINRIGYDSLFYYGLHYIFIRTLYLVYGKTGITATGNEWVLVGLAVFSVCVVVAVLTPWNAFVLKYMPWCLGKRKR